LDAYAHALQCTRSDVVRRVLYRRFKQLLPQWSPEQLEEIYSIEAGIERDYGKDKCIAIYIDPEFENYIERRHLGRLFYETTMCQSTLRGYFGLYSLPAPENPYAKGVSLGPGKGRVMAVRTAEGLAEYANRKKSNA
jgi:hypothetical protein